MPSTCQWLSKQRCVLSVCVPLALAVNHSTSADMGHCAKPLEQAHHNLVQLG